MNDPSDGDWHGPTVENFYCANGDDHRWPAGKDDAECEVCGLSYDDWTED